MKPEYRKLLNELTQDVNDIKSKGWMHTALVSHFRNLTNVCGNLEAVTHGEADCIVDEYLND